jgi:hypothetical protein
LFPQTNTWYGKLHDHTSGRAESQGDVEIRSMNQQIVHKLALQVIDDMGGAFNGTRITLAKINGRRWPRDQRRSGQQNQLNERFVREWLRAMVAAEYLDYHPLTDQYRKSEEI